MAPYTFRATASGVPECQMVTLRIILGVKVFVSFMGRVITIPALPAADGERYPTSSPAVWMSGRPEVSGRDITFLLHKAAVRVVMSQRYVTPEEVSATMSEDEAPSWASAGLLMGYDGLIVSVSSLSST